MNSSNTLISTMQLTKSYLLDQWTPFGTKETYIPTICDTLRTIAQQYLTPLVATSTVCDYCFDWDPSQGNSSFIWYTVVGLECLSRSIESLYPQRITRTQLVLGYPKVSRFCKEKLNDLDFFKSYCTLMNFKNYQDVFVHWNQNFNKGGTCAGEVFSLLKVLNQDPSQSTSELLKRIPTKEIFLLQMVHGILLEFENLKINQEKPIEELLPFIQKSSLDLKLQSFYTSMAEKYFEDYTTEEKKELLLKGNRGQIAQEMIRNSKETVSFDSEEEIFSFITESILLSFPVDNSITFKTHFLNELKKFAPRYASDEELAGIISTMPNFQQIEDIRTLFNKHSQKNDLLNSWIYELSRSKEVDNVFISLCTCLGNKTIQSTKDILSLLSTTPQIYDDSLNGKALYQEVQNYFSHEIGIQSSGSCEFDCMTEDEEIIQKLCNDFLANIPNPSHHEIACTLSWTNLPEQKVMKKKFGHINFIQVTGQYIRTYDSKVKMRHFKTKEEAFKHLINSIKKYFIFKEPGATCKVEAYLLPKKQSSPSLSLASLNVAEERKL